MPDHYESAMLHTRNYTAVNNARCAIWTVVKTTKSITNIINRCFCCLYETNR
jgi:hypothetical protein